MVRRALIAVFTAMLFAGCGANGILGEQPVTSTFRDPQGDAAQTSGTNYDVTLIRTSRTSTNLSVEVTFAQGVALPGAGQSPGPTQLSGWVEFDTDRNSATGNPSACSPLPFALGVDRYLDLRFRNPDGTYEVLDHTFNSTGRAAVAASGNRVMFHLTPSALGDLHTYLVVVAGNGLSGFTPTDCAPDQGGAVVTRKDLPTPTRR
ncbi:MAG: hypothetical protein QN163_01905 [Armatimonadota bacterium]|nr:hypothetical protein [Armatimonadota bacterium]MDR5696322.1 hypothetical protein [Armatimonadota bacterium]